MREKGGRRQCSYDKSSSHSGLGEYYGGIVIVREHSSSIWLVTVIIEEKEVDRKSLMFPFYGTYFP